MDIKPDFTGHSAVSGSSFPTPEKERPGEETLSDRVTIEVVLAHKEPSPSQGCGAAFFNLSSGMTLQDAASSTAITPGDPAALIAEQLKKLEQNRVSFFRSRGFHIPLLMKETKKISAEEAAKILTEGSRRERDSIQAVVDNITVLRPFKSVDVPELLAFKKIDGSFHLPHPELARFLQEAAMDDMKFSTRDEEVKEAFGAYKLLTRVDCEDKPIIVTHWNTELMSIKRADTSDVTALRNELKEMKDMQSRLGGEKDLFELVKKPVQGTSLEERYEIIRGIYDHSQDSGNSGNTSSHVERDWDYLQEKSGSGEKLIELGKLYERMLEAKGDRCRSNNYRESLDLIISHLSEDPGGYNAFIDLIKRGISIPAAVAIHSSLNPKEGDYPTAALMFSNDSNCSFYWDPEKVRLAKLAMEPVEGTTLKERIDIITGIFEHVRDSNSSARSWKNTVNEYEYIKSRAKSGSEFSKIGALYTGMLRARGSCYYSDDYREGLDLIISHLAENPGGYSALIDLIKRGISIPAAVSIHSSLNPEEGDYPEAAALFSNNANNYFFWDSEKVKLVMEPVEGTTLKERIEVIAGIFDYVRDGNYSSNTWRNAKDDYHNLLKRSRDGKDFLEIARLYQGILKATGSTYRNKSHGRALGLVVDELGGSAEKYNTFLSLLSHNRNIDYSIEAHEKIKKPVKDEDISIRINAAKKLMGNQFILRYEMACRNIPDRETILDTAELLSAITGICSSKREADYEALLQKIQGLKGSESGATVAGLVRYIDADQPESLVELIKLVASGNGKESFGEKKDIFCAHFNDYYGENRNNLSQALEDYKIISKYLEPSDSLADASKGFDMLFSLVKATKDAKEKSALLLTRETLEFLGDGRGKGVYGQISIIELITELSEMLMVSKDLEEARRQLLHRYEAGQGSKVEEVDNKVIIGGIKLDVNPLARKKKALPQ